MLPKLGAGVVVLNESGRVLLVHEGYGLRRWGLPGGATESGEDVRATAMREAKEETGLDVALDEMVGEYRISYGDGSDDLNVSIFMARVVGGVLQPAPDEIEDVTWVSPDRLPSPLTNVAPAAISDAISGVRGVTRSLHAARPSH